MNFSFRNRSTAISTALCGAGLCLLVLALPLSAGIEQRNAPATIGPGSQILPAPSGYKFPNSQIYVLAVEWHFFNAGIARVRMDSAGVQQKVSAQADSIGMVNSLYGIHDRFEAYFDPHTFCSQRVVKHSEEGSHKRNTEVRFDYPHRVSVLDEKNLKTGETKHTENDIPTCITDVVTGFYYIAAHPLEVRNSYTFPINDGGRTTDVRAVVEAKDQVKVPAGTYQTVRVVAEPITGPLKGKAKVWAWFTDDANHTPVQMRAKLGWGTLLFRLQRIEK